MNQHDFQNWVEIHSAKIVDAHRQIRRMYPVREFFSNPADYNVIREQDRYVKTERAFLIELSESELSKMIEFEKRVFGNNDGFNSHHYNMFITMLEQKEQEAMLRETNDAVKKAYEHYSLMLTIAKSKENN